MTLTWSDLKVAAPDHEILNGISGKLTSPLTVVFGPNGSGKTTLLKTLIGHTSPSEGRVFLDHKDITQASAATRHHKGIASLSQHSLPIPGLTIASYLSLFDPEAVALTLDTISQANLKHIKPTNFFNLHPPAIRRLFDILLTLYSSKKYIFLDEPLANLPEPYVELVLTLMNHITARSKIFVIEHRSEFFEWATRRDTYGYFLNNGALAGSGKLPELLVTPTVLNLYGRMI